ncbi:PAS domain-containing sensor histidine kinase [Salinigranum sp. GCM10025319]|uniref:PAS domain-containing sensor histidine kinase n=1 Tax=Salinigranum sp. GCM10025319 TaxID=3252687 RepID=UPI003612D87D
MDTREAELALLDNTLDIVVVLDAEGRFQYANAAVERVLGYEPAALLGSDAFDYIHPEDCPAVLGGFEDLVSTTDRTHDGAEFRFRDSEGSWVWLAARMSSERAARLGGYVVSCRDVTDRRRAEAEKRRAHEQLCNIAEHTTDVLWMFSADWEELLFVNSAYEELWGRSIEELEANPREFVRGAHPADRDGIREAMARLSAGEPVNLEYRVNADDEYQTWVWVQGYPIVDDDGTVTRAVGFARDVTDRRERERQLLVMDRLLRHNLRNDMNLVLGHAEQARDHGGEAVSDDIDKIVETGNGLLRTAEKERDIVALLASDGDPDAIDLLSVVRDACDAVRTRYPEATVETTLPAAARVRAIPKLSEAVVELLSNAVEHTDHDAPTVGLTVRLHDERVDLVVDDECSHISTQEIRVLRGERNVGSVYHSSGLGLWLVYWAVDRSGGEVTFETTDRGNAVTISLERVDPFD